MSNYSDKLKDPRWQKKRLEIMQRDDWSCGICLDDSKTLNVHHKMYNSNLEPWEYPNEMLITLCDECHQREKGREKTEAELIYNLRKIFSHDAIKMINIGFRDIKLYQLPDLVADAIRYSLVNEDIQKLLLSMAFSDENLPSTMRDVEYHITNLLCQYSEEGKYAQ